MWYTRKRFNWELLQNSTKMLQAFRKFDYWQLVHHLPNLLIFLLHKLNAWEDHPSKLINIKQIKKQKRGYLKKKVPVPTPELTSLMIQWQHTEYTSRVKKWCWLHFTNILGVLMGAAWSYQPTRKHNITLWNLLYNLIYMWIRLHWHHTRFLEIKKTDCW